MNVVLVILFGLFVGTALDRLIRRLAFEKSPVWPWRDHCEACLQPIPVEVKLPVVGYLLSGGRCRTCRSPLPMRRVLVELIAAAGIATLYYIRVLGQPGFLPESS